MNELKTFEFKLNLKKNIIKKALITILYTQNRKSNKYYRGNFVSR